MKPAQSRGWRAGPFRQRGFIRIGSQRRDGHHALSAAGAEPQAAAEAVEGSEARYTHRFACIRHGNLEAEQSLTSWAQGLLLDDSAPGPSHDAAQMRCECEVTDRQCSFTAEAQASHEGGSQCSTDSRCRSDDPHRQCCLAQQPAKSLKMQATWPTAVTAWDNFFLGWSATGQLTGWFADRNEPAVRSAAFRDAGRGESQVLDGATPSPTSGAARTRARCCSPAAPAAPTAWT